MAGSSKAKKVSRAAKINKIKQSGQKFATSVEPAAIETGSKRYFEKLSNAAWLFALAVVFFLLYLLKMFAVRDYAGDDCIYLYQSKLVSEGIRPYSGFAMAHPPLQTLFTALLFKIFGFQPMLYKALPIAWYAIGGIALAATVRMEIGKVASVAAAALYLFSYEPLRASSHYTGVNMTVALLLIALLAYRRGAIRSAAVFCVASVFTRLYAAPGVAALAIFSLMADRKQGLKLIAWGAGLGAAAFAVVGAWAGFGEMIHNMILYHAQKTPMRPDALPNMRNTVLFHNATIALLFALSLPAVAWSAADAFRGKDKVMSTLGRLRAALTGKETGFVLLCAWIAIAFLAVLLNMKRVWMYYFVPSFPFAAVAAGWLVQMWVDSAGRIAARGFGLSKASIAKKEMAKAISLLILFVMGWLLSPLLERNLKYYEQEADKAQEDRASRYAWKPALLPDVLNDFVRKAVWRDERIVGERYLSLTYYLWHESRDLEIVGEVVKVIEQNTSPNGEIFGDSGTVPLFALMSQRRIAANEVDTNIQRYRSGNADPVELIRRIDNPKTEMIILRPRFGVGGLPELMRLVAEKYEKIHSVRSAQGTVFNLYKRRG